MTMAGKQVCNPKCVKNIYNIIGMPHSVQKVGLI